MSLFWLLYVVHCLSFVSACHVSHVNRYLPSCSHSSGSDHLILQNQFSYSFPFPSLASFIFQCMISASSRGAFKPFPSHFPFQSPSSLYFLHNPSLPHNRRTNPSPRAPYTDISPTSSLPTSFEVFSYPISYRFTEV